MASAPRWTHSMARELGNGTHDPADPARTAPEAVEDTHRMIFGKRPAPRSPAVRILRSIAMAAIVVGFLGWLVTGSGVGAAVGAAGLIVWFGATLRGS